MNIHEKYCKAITMLDKAMEIAREAITCAEQYSGGESETAKSLEDQCDQLMKEMDSLQ